MLFTSFGNGRVRSQRGTLDHKQPPRDDCLILCSAGVHHSSLSFGSWFCAFPGIASHSSSCLQQVRPWMKLRFEGRCGCFHFASGGGRRSPERRGRTRCPNSRILADNGGAGMCRVSSKSRTGLACLTMTTICGWSRTQEL